MTELSHKVPEPFCREAFWATVINENRFTRVLEIGVWKGDFAAALLERCPDITEYWMVDPWRQLERWNKPCNVDDIQFESVQREALTKTDPAASKRRVLRGTTAEVIDEVGEEALDFIYVDGDHTLRGITVDLIRAWPKLRLGGVLGGDDFTPTAWQHDAAFEPTLVNPFAVYFAEAMGVPITTLPGGQFLIHKNPASGFAVDDRAGTAGDASVRSLIMKGRTALTERVGRTRSGVLRSAQTAVANALSHRSPLFRERRNKRNGLPDFPRDIAAAGCLLIHIPKTAGISLSIALYGRSLGHKTLAEWETEYPYTISKLRTVAVVRDPVDRFASAFAFLKAGGMNNTDQEFAQRFLDPYASCDDLAKALIDPALQNALLSDGWHFRRQVDFVRGIRGAVNVDVLIPFERLDEGVSHLARRINRPISLPAFNRTGSPKPLMDKHSVQVIEAIYREDFELWNKASNGISHNCRS
jgi:hypothetical protein